MHVCELHLAFNFVAMIQRGNLMVPGINSALYFRFSKEGMFNKTLYLRVCSLCKVLHDSLMRVNLYASYLMARITLKCGSEIASWED